MGKAARYVLALLILSIAGLFLWPLIFTPPLEDFRGEEVFQAGAKKVFQATCSADFIRFQCVGCHDLQGRGEFRQNLTPRGLEYLDRSLGCISVLGTIHEQDQPRDDPEWRSRIDATRNHFSEFFCSRCHDVDGGGLTTIGLTSYGLAMHDAGMGCIQCLNSIKERAGRSDLLPVPSLQSLSILPDVPFLPEAPD